jgi:hypothetical protein
VARLLKRYLLGSSYPVVFSTETRTELSLAVVFSTETRTELSLAARTSHPERIGGGGSLQGALVVHGHERITCSGDGASKCYMQWQRRRRELLAAASTTAIHDEDIGDFDCMAPLFSFLGCAVMHNPSRCVCLVKRIVNQIWISVLACFHPWLVNLYDYPNNISPG